MFFNESHSIRALGKETYGISKQRHFKELMLVQNIPMTSSYLVIKNILHIVFFILNNLVKTYRFTL